jgi:2-isopropylmalate synthase
MTETETRAPIRLARWTVTSGSATQSRGAVVLEAGDGHWEAKAEGNGAVDALFRAVDAALAEILSDHPRLIAYDVHALGEGPDAEGAVTVRIAPPAAAAGARASGRFTGSAQGTNIIAASIEAYVQAINRMLGEASWAGATDAAARKRPRRSSGRRAEFDREQAEHDTTAWFER